MRLPDKQWATKPEYQSLLFFCQLLDDMVWDRSRDSHRAPSMNTFHLCLETIRTWAEVQTSSIREGILSPILEELLARSRSDFTISTHFSEHRDRLEFALDNESSLSAKVGAVARFHRSIEASYLKRLRDDIQNIIEKPKPVSKERLTQLVGTFCSYLQNLGYTTLHISRRLNEAFIFADVQERPVRALQDFFATFSGKPLTFDVIMSVSEQLASADSGIHFEIYTGKAPVIGREASPFENVEAEGGRIIQFENIVAHDAFAAKIRVESTLALIRAAAYTARPDALFTWLPEAIVTDVQSKKRSLVQQWTEPLRQRYLDRSSYDYRAAGERIRGIFEDKLPPQDSNRLKNALLGYANAFHSESPSTQLIAVWSSLEGLLPQSQPGESRIDTIIRYSLACQRTVYLRNLFRWSFLDHLEIDKDRFFLLLDRLPGYSERLSKFVAILCFSEHKALSDELGAFAGPSPLTSQRGFRLFKAAQKAKELQSLVENHERRVAWQLRRIYRERNRIVHQANPSTSVDSLILSLNEYLNVVFEVLFMPNETRPYAMGLDEIFNEIAVDESFRVQKARSIGSESLTKANAPIVLGFELR